MQITIVYSSVLIRKFYDELTPEQQKVVDECGKLAVNTKED